MAETMTALVERNRAHLAAYSAAARSEGFDSKAEDAFLSAADLAAGNTIENDPPRLRNKADLVAAVSYIAEDRDFLQEGHGRVMARVLEYLTEPEPSSKEGESIESMMRELRILHDRPPTQDEDDFDTPSEFEILRDRILATPPVSACDVALQLMADTHWGACEISDGFFEQLAALSGQETVQ